jgi:hypothetical protein
MSVRRQWILIAVVFVVGVALIPLVPLLTGIDGQLVAYGGPMAGNDRPAIDNEPVPHRTILVLKADTQEVVATTVTDAAGRFSVRVAPGRYLLEAPGVPYPGPTAVGEVAGSPGAGPSPCAVGLFGHAQATLVIPIR